MPSSLALSTSSRPAAAAAGVRVAAGVAATLAVALAAHVAFPLPFTPVPFTLQPLAVLVVGLLLGPVDGALALLAYLAEGAAGLPVFSPTGPGGLLQLLGPTGGFLMAYPAVAFVTGSISRRLVHRAGHYVAAAVACTAATLLLFASGAAWLSHFQPSSAHALWMAAVAPFLPGEAVKILIAAGIYRAFQPNAGR